MEQKLEYRTTTQPPEFYPATDTSQAAIRTLLLTIRQALIMVLGAIEDYLGKPRSIVPRHKK